VRIVIAGGTGFLGRPLAERLARAGWEVIVLTRSLPSGSVVQDPQERPPVARAGWQPDGSTGPWAALVDGAHAVVNLAGESIAARRWSARQKARIRDSRLLATRSLVAAIRAARQRPAVLVSGSAVGYYGDRGDELLTEGAASGSDFLAQVAAEWEAAAQPAAALGTRLVLLRTGIVLARDGGALAKLLPPFRFFLGGPLGSGRQYMPWIHRDDWIRLVEWAIDREAVVGPLNATAPNPVPNLQFARTLGQLLGRPAVLPTPAFVLRLLLGEMADALLLGGQRAIPARALELGFEFHHPDLAAALRAILEQP
jgi:uncharacterized protein (TIGR01777 family)